jgi:uncharacterized repeat protein (TIGR01451 family)
MSYEERHPSIVGATKPGRQSKAFDPFSRRRNALTLVSVGLVLCAWLVLAGPAVHAATPASGPLGVAIAAYPGDTVTTTPTESADAGNDLTYQVTVTNATSSAQSNVAVPVTLPANFTLHAGSITPSAGTTAVAAGVLTWSIPSLAAASSATLSYSETTDAPSTTETDSATVSVTSDQSTTAGTAMASVTVVPAADLTVSITDGVDAVTPGGSDV